MRLTLRTLLAYLDDTLEPHEIREIGQKVAESDAAQELVARIKQITRRRRLTTPPASGAGAKFDANTVAEYLDNELSSELVAELEKTCLESDVHLAEVASCHQILTLVLGEPALVPPTARERMYGLVKGREAIPFRKARANAGAGDADDAPDRDAEDPLLPGMPSSRGWLIWALPVVAVLVLAALAVAVWQAQAPPLNVAASRANPVPPVVPADSGATPPTTPVDVKTPITPVAPPPVAPVEPPPAIPVEPPAPDKQPPDVRPSPPSKVRAAVGQYLVPVKLGPSILVQRQTGQPAWKRLTNGNPVFTTDDLVSLPGYNSELALGADGGARLLLHGHVREFTPRNVPEMDFLMESAVRLHQPEAGFDLDLTLDRGRIYLSDRRQNGPVKIRLRFGGDPAQNLPGEIWDLTLLEPETEVGIDLLQGYTRDIDYKKGETPLQEMYLTVLTGRAGVKIDYREYSNLPPAVIHWDNKGRGASEPQPLPPQVLAQVRAVWGKAPPAVNPQQDPDNVIGRMREALDKLSLIMDDRKTVDAALREAEKAADSPTMTRVLAVYSFGAVDAMDKLLDVLFTDEDANHYADRNAALFTLRRWLSRSATNGDLLYDAKKDTGLLMKYYKRSSDAETTLDLLHDFSDENARKKSTFEYLTTGLVSDQQPIRELAYWHLMRLSVWARVALPPYNAAWDKDQRNAAAEAWKKLVNNGDLPPPPPGPPAPAPK